MYHSPNIGSKGDYSRRLIWAGRVARMEKGRSTFKILTGRPTGNRPLGRPRRRWEANIEMDLKKINIYLDTRNLVDYSISHGVSFIVYPTFIMLTPWNTQNACVSYH